MKEVRAFFELTALSLLPSLVLLLALLRRPGAETVFTAAAVFPAAPAGEVRSGHPRMAAVSAADGTQSASEAAAPVSGDRETMLTILIGDEPVAMNLRDYLLGVVAAEMPASFEPEALKAQAVAARTDTIYRLQVSKPHGNAACCTDAGCCKAYASPSELRERWGAEYDRWAEKIAAAVDGTDGEVIVYDGAPIFAAFHASSAGSTECSENVWLSALPYLRSVPTLETERDVPRFRETISFTAEELAARLLEACPDASLSGDPAGWLTDAKRSDSGRLRSVKAGGVSLSGSSLRSILGLRSAAVTWTVTGEGFTFETLGFGHGVGMSQYGAEVMAEGGSTCGEILLHYYTGAAMGSWMEVFRG